MKRFLLVFIILMLSVSATALGNSPRFVALDPIGNRMEIFGADLKSAGFVKTGPRPYNVKPLPDHTGYVLLYLGSETMVGAMKDPGGILYLDNQMNPTSRKITFSGLVISEFYDKELNTWFVFTAENPKSENTTHTLNIVQLQDGTVQTVSLTSAPAFFKIKDASKLAVATVGNSEAKIKPELFLIDLTTLACDTYPLTLNPGAIFFIDNDRLLVACGGYHKSQNYLFNLFESSDTQTTEPATLHLVNTRLKTVKTITTGYSPLAIIQDQSKPDVFYFASTAEPNSSEPSGLVQVLSGDVVTAQLQIDTEPVYLAQARTGNLCILGRDEFFLIDPVNSKIVTKLKYDLKIDALRLSPDGKTGYLTNVNSNYMDIINLSDGNRQVRLKIGKPSILGSFSLNKLINNAYPPVIGMQKRLQRNPERISRNYRMVPVTDSETMYVTSSNSEVIIVDLKNNTLKGSLKFKGFGFGGIHLTPNSKYIVVPTSSYWNLLKPDQAKPVLSLLINNDDDKSAPENGYYSPDGSLLVIPFEKSIYVINTDAGKFLGRLKSKIENPIIVWP